MVKALEHGPRLVKENAAGLRQLDPARLAAEQLHLEFLLDRLDLLAEWGLYYARSVDRCNTVTTCPKRLTAESSAN